MKDAYGRLVQFETTKEGTETLVVDGTLMHSKYYPEKDAIAWVHRQEEQLLKKKRIVVYGLALGYHIREIQRIAAPDVKIQVFDMDFELYRITKEKLSDIFKDPRIQLNIGETAGFFNQFSEAISSVEDIFIYKPSLKVLPDHYHEFKLAMDRFDLGKTTVKVFGDVMKDNLAKNLQLQCGEVQEFLTSIDLNGRPIVVAAAGPTLDLAINELLEFRDQLVILSTGSALKPLRLHGILPDMVCITEPSDIVTCQIEEVGPLQIPLCFLSTASHQAVSSYNGPKYIFFNEENETGVVVETGKSVATAVVSIAVLMGTDTIIFVGQDLAFINNRSHCAGYANQTINGVGASTLKVTGVGGVELETSSVFLYFKNWIENKIKKNSQIQFINCSRGARIIGTKEMSLTDAVASSQKKRAGE